MARNNSSQGRQGDRLSSSRHSKMSVAEGISQMRQLNESRSINTLARPQDLQAMPANGKLADQESSTETSGIPSGIIKSYGITIGKQFVNSVGSRVGTFTKSSAAQNQVNNVSSVINDGADIYAAFAINPAVGAVAILQKAMEIGFKAYDLMVKIEERQMSHTKSVERLGRVVSTRGR